MKRASAIVTNRGGRTCHAAIIARELGIRRWSAAATPPRCSSDGSWSPWSAPKATPAMSTKACSRCEVTRCGAGRCRRCPVKIMMNVGNPQLAFDFASMPNCGVGLARLEFIINSKIGVHPKAILDYPKIDARP